MEAALAPSTLKIVNESHLHAGHMGNPDGAPDAETHFKWALWACSAYCIAVGRWHAHRVHCSLIQCGMRRVEVVSGAFEGKSRLQCHRLVYELLDDELKGGVHALSLRTKAA